MKEFAMAHPYLTTLIVFWILLASESILKTWAIAFGNRKRKGVETEDEHIRS